MSKEDLAIVISSILIFTAISGAVFVIGSEISRRRSVGTRLKKNKSGVSTDASVGHDIEYTHVERSVPIVDYRILEKLLSDNNRTKLRNDLIRAGIFNPSGPAIYVATIIIAVLLCAAAGFFIIRLYFYHLPIYLQISIMAVSAYAGYFIPDAYLRSRLSATKQEYLSVFPDYLDLLVVCVDAGLSLNASLDRVTQEFYGRSSALATNFSVLLQEIRVGREMTDALDNLADRMDVDEIRSFCTLIKQSIELGSDVAEALRVYSEEMRVKRMFRAEEEANKLPVKMLIPLGLFIFPVILIVILAPIAVRITNMGK